jgi:hypothetical protein
MIALVGVLCNSAATFAQDAKYSQHGPALLPDPKVTPGSIAITDKATVCGTKWGSDERHVTLAMKREVYANYRTSPGVGVCAWVNRTTKTGKQAREGCEVDHLISRELGGADAIPNLWPQPYNPKPGAHEKDLLENELHKEVCRGLISLEDAQREIRTDWYAAYLKPLKGILVSRRDVAYGDLSKCADWSSLFRTDGNLVQGRLPPVGAEGIAHKPAGVCSALWRWPSPLM